MMPITLDAEICCLCRKTGDLRQSEAEALGCKDRHLESFRPFKSQPHHNGAYGEAGTRIYLGVPLILPVNSFDDPDIPPDIEVRATAYINKEGHAELCVRPDDQRKDKLQRKFVLAYISAVRPDLVRLYLMGWAYGYEVAQPQYWKNPNGKGFAWFMPDIHLHRITNLMP